MASTFTDLGIEKMATGENAGTWGTKTNTNLDIIEKSIAGYVEQAVTSGGTTQLTIQDGDATESTSVARHAVIKLTGTITGNSIVTVPDSVEKVYIVTNGTSGAYTVQFKTASGTGITFGVSEKTTRLVYSDGTNLVDSGFSGASDMEGRELVLDADGDTSLTADTDDQIDIKIAGADDFQFTANTFTAQSGSTIAAQALTATTITTTGAIAIPNDGNIGSAGDADAIAISSSGVVTFSQSPVFPDGSIAGADIDIDGTTDIGAAIVDADEFLIDDGGGGTNRRTDASRIKTYIADVTLTTAAQTNITSLGTLTTLTVDNVIINGSTIGHTGDTDLITVASGIATVAGEVSMTTLDIGGTNVTSTAAELNIMDGGTSATSTTVADADRVVLNDNGTMVQVAVTDLAAYFDDEITAMPNLVTTAATTVGALNSGSITSGFGSIDNGSSTITTTGLISGGSLDIDDVLINGTTIGHTDDTDLITLADGIATVAGEISVTTLDIGGTNVTATAAEINLIDGGTARGTTAVADGDGLLVNDAGTMRMTNVTTLKTYFQTGVTASSIAADDISAGDGAVNFTTSSGNITIDAAANDSDVIFKGTDDSSDITMLTLDGSDAGSATFNDKVTIGDGKLVLNSTAVTSTAAELNLLDGVSGLVQADLTKLAAVDSTAAELNIVDGGTSATGTTLVDADRFVVNDNGTMVQVAASDLITYVNANSSAASTGKAIAMALVFG